MTWRAGASAHHATAAGVGISLAIMLVLTGCEIFAGPGSRHPEGTSSRQAASSPREAVPSALLDPNDPELPAPLIDTGRLISGGPGPEGIPAIDRPRFLAPHEIDWLSDKEPVLALAVDGAPRAYPIQIMIWHEIVNDTVGGVPVTVTYCPLCNSALAFGRQVGHRVLDFGVSGLLYNSDLVMFDRQTRSLWPQIEGRAVAGVLTGTELTRYTVTTVPWGEWKKANPDGEVLSRDTGHRRNYGRNPYPGYDDPGSKPFLLDVRADNRLPPKTRVVGLGRGGRAVALTLDRVGADRVIETTLAGRPVVVWAGPVSASPLDQDEISEGTEFVTAAAFDPVAGKKRLRFRAVGGEFMDEQTGSRWTFQGRAHSGPLAGTRLQPVTHIDTFWFAWVAFMPQTALIR